jgi:hypothetical protein
MGKTCGTHGKDELYVQKFSRRSLEYLALEGRLKLKRVLKKTEWEAVY